MRHSLGTVRRRSFPPLNLHRPASVCRNRGRLPSSRCIESARTHRARACALPLRASDTTLRLPGTNPNVFCCPLLVQVSGAQFSWLDLLLSRGRSRVQVPSLPRIRNMTSSLALNPARGNQRDKNSALIFHRIRSSLWEWSMIRHLTVKEFNLSTLHRCTRQALDHVLRFRSVEPPRCVVRWIVESICYAAR
jgi:hypothetical protein